MSEPRERAAGPGTAQPRNPRAAPRGPGGACAARTVPAPSCGRRSRSAAPARPGPAMPRLLLLLLLLLVPHFGRAAAPSPGNSTEPPRAATRNETQSGLEHESGPRLSVGSGLPVLRRAVYVLSALSALAAFSFMLRAFRLKKPQRKKYGLLSSQDESIELGSLDSDEDTVFESRNLRR